MARTIEIIGGIKYITNGDGVPATLIGAGGKAIQENFITLQNSIIDNTTALDDKLSKSATGTQTMAGPLALNSTTAIGDSQEFATFRHASSGTYAIYQSAGGQTTINSATGTTNVVGGINATGGLTAAGATINGPSGGDLLSLVYASTRVKINTYDADYGSAATFKANSNGGIVIVSAGGAGEGGPIELRPKADQPVIITGSASITGNTTVDGDHNVVGNLNLGNDFRINNSVQGRGYINNTVGDLYIDTESGHGFHFRQGNEENLTIGHGGITVTGSASISSNVGIAGNATVGGILTAGNLVGYGTVTAPAFYATSNDSRLGYGGTTNYLRGINVFNDSGGTSTFSDVVNLGGSSGHSYFDASGDLNARTGQTFTLKNSIGLEVLSVAAGNLSLPYSPDFSGTPTFNGGIEMRGSTGIYGFSFSPLPIRAYTGQVLVLGDSSTALTGNVIDMALPTTFRSTVNINGNRIKGYTATNYADNAAALVGGLSIGDFYVTTAGEVRCVV